ncbi:MAG: hypothetical protein ACI89J_004255 [Hyphomicrobiaceae bacterium]|jgi:hypothetical protein
MAARTTSKARQTGGSRSPAKTVAAKKVVARKAPAKSAKASNAKSAKKQVTANTAMPADGLATGMPLEQNEALRAELEQAQARIAELEELNKNVVNRIDWVIDSLQGALKR